MGICTGRITLERSALYLHFLEILKGLSDLVEWFLQIKNNDKVKINMNLWKNI